jgi:small subunit ribosomal protein S9
VIEEEERQDGPEQPEEPQEPQEIQEPQEEAAAPAEEQPAEPEAQPPEAETPPAEPEAEEQPAEPEAEVEEQPAEEPPAEPQPQPEAGAEPAEERARPKRGKKDKKREDEVIPGEHLEPDLVLEEEERQEAEMAQFPGAEVAEEAEPGVEPPPEAPEPEADAEAVAHEPLDLAADARYKATGKRKTAVARVILRPGSGTYSVNGRGLDQFFPRVRLQKIARQPLDTAGYGSRMDVVARIHGGGVSAQAGALRHGIARALVEADPTLRIELKRRGFLTRDPREKERKKAGLKKARKRPQFSKR